LDQDSTIIAVVEMSQSSWLVGGVLPALSVGRARSWSRALSVCLPYCIAGATSQSGLAAQSRGLQLPSKPAATASGWRAGSYRGEIRGRETSRFVADSPLEETGFELLVRGRGEAGCHAF
jgi:hypothetical protein